MSVQTLVVITQDDQGNLNVQTQMDLPNLVFLLERIKADALREPPMQQANVAVPPTELVVLLNSRRQPGGD